MDMYWVDIPVTIFTLLFITYINVWEWTEIIQDHNFNDV